MPEAQSKPLPGLEGVDAGDTAIGRVRQDELLYRGYDINDLIESATFSEVAHLLLLDHKPDRDELRAFRAELAALRPLPCEVRGLLDHIADKGDPMDVLRTAVSFIGQLDREVSPTSAESELQAAKSLIARMPTVIGYCQAVRDGRNPVEPDPKLDHPANVLWCLTGQRPSDLFARVLDIGLILYAEHGYNASTFAGRVIAGTLSDTYSAVCGALGALKGNLHGGANAATVDMLLNIGSPNHVRQFLDDCFAHNRTIPGFGHRVYKQGDLRVPILLEWGRKIAEQIGPEALRWFEIADHVQQIMRDKKGLHPNADLACGLTFYTMGVPPEQFTPIFAAGHVAGWCAHVLEQHSNNCLIRPSSTYVGPAHRSWNGD